MKRQQTIPDDSLHRESLLPTIFPHSIEWTTLGARKFLTRDWADKIGTVALSVSVGAHISID
ncbi:hypothetical protein [Gimesia benthica]|jgi:hypothetical protein|uniref:Uncharacterized protein n=1 Tax=Gimesia benthica TaxID=2608982 RepID=A0A6I6ALX0_9PLAN|nr:hypothetical protein [Gimesia benthica]QGQ26215.1 hypothetical protein F1728_27600 [Gimesia benthica]HAW32127.1 hypothetical protein [Planctomycetaceae bacterium]